MPKPQIAALTEPVSKATEEFRAFAEKGAEQSREAYDKFKNIAEETQRTLETIFATNSSVSNELSLKAIVAMRLSAETDLSHLEALAGAKTFSEAIELQNAYLRKRMEQSVEQAKEFQAVASKAAEDVARPVKAAVESSLKNFQPTKA